MEAVQECSSARSGEEDDLLHRINKRFRFGHSKNIQTTEDVEMSEAAKHNLSFKDKLVGYSVHSHAEKDND